MPVITRIGVACFLIATGCSEASESEATDVLPTISIDTTVGDSGNNESADTASIGLDAKAPDAEMPGVDVSPSCQCGTLEYCTDDNICAPDLCLQGATTCDSLTARLICSDDGGTRTVVPCDDSSVCYLGQCHPIVCTPETSTGCDEDGNRQVCNGLGIDVNAIPCPGGTVCESGECHPIRPNVVLVVDSSDSMNDLYAKPGAAAGSCMGPECPPWDFPNCDDPQAPQSRLGRVKQALGLLIDSPAANAARLALQRFPQTPGHESGCDHGYWGSLSSISGDDDKHVLEETTLDTSIGQIMLAPFPTDEKSSDISAMKTWTDFVEEVVPTDIDCDYDWDCASKLCEGWPRKCQEMVNPELRAVGSTPLGKSLFYAAEYLRLKALVDGKPCELDSDCGSPNHACVDETCRNPHVACRQTAIIVFTDGQETSYELASDFFNPRNQARRLHFGLGCDTDVNCTNGATCVDGYCVPPPGALPDSVAFTPFADSEGANHVLGPDLLPRPMTVHVVDASNGGKGSDTNALIAAWGGGKHVPVDLEDIDSLVAELLILLDVKAPKGCQP